MVTIYIIFNYFIRFLSIALVLYALLSWLPGARESSLGRLIEKIVDPLLAPLYRFNLQYGGFDFTTLVALILLQVLNRLLYFILLW
ncbi:YggT family protein [Streptococcus dentapri]|uniref:YggT family protein n=1 Tax=Streptococcus dentapri TaxID=573564 RepID=A0ABV8CZG3_9STRE